MLTTKGPGSGVSPTRLDEVLGKKAAVSIPADRVINEDDIIW